MCVGRGRGDKEQAMSQDDPNGMQDDVREFGRQLSPAELNRVNAVIDAVDAAAQYDATAPLAEAHDELGVYFKAMADALRERFLLGDGER
jgi:hypothetical protein